METEQLILRKLTHADAPFVLELLNQPSFVRFIGDRGVRTVADAETYLTNGPLASYERFDFGLLAVVLKTTREPIGICGLIQRDTLPDVDLGFALLPAYEGKGFAFEAASAVLNDGFQKRKLPRIVAIVSPENARSIRLLERLGFTFERSVPEEGILLYASGTIAPT